MFLSDLLAYCFVCRFLVKSFLERGYLTLLYNFRRLEKCYVLLRRVGGWYKNTILGSIENKTTSVTTHFKSVSSSSKADILNI